MPSLEKIIETQSKTNRVGANISSPSHTTVHAVRHTVVQLNFNESA